MFLLGEYCEGEARDIADRLKKVGMKVDIKTFTTSRMELFHFLEGRMSVIKGELKETTFKRYERYIIALREVVAEGAGPDDFRERFRLAVDPQVNEKRKRFCEIMEGSIPEGENAAMREDSSGIFRVFLDVSNAESFVNAVLERNEIRIGEDVGDKLDDPILRVFDETEGEDEDEKESDLARTTTVFTLEPKAQVFVDEFHSVLSEVLDEEFEEEYDEKYMRLVFLGKLISDLKEPTSGWLSMEDFRKRCKFEMENDGDLLEIDGRRAVDELARVLEKNGIIKTKGGSAKWRR
jgi:hypothetical protein